MTTMSKMIERTSLPHPEVMPKWLEGVYTSFAWNDELTFYTNNPEGVEWYNGDTHSNTVKEFSFNIEQAYEKHPEMKGEIDAVLGETAVAAQPKQTAETLTPLLWNAYKDVLNEEALAALRDVIESGNIVYSDTAKSILRAFDWGKTYQGWSFWNSVNAGEYNKDVIDERVVALKYNPENVMLENKTQAVSENNSPEIVGKIKSTGGSSDYYKLTIYTTSGETFQCEVGDVIQAMVGDNFQLGNVLKASRRMWLDAQGGGKENVDMHYDREKVKYFVDDFVQRYGSKQ